MNQHYVPKVYLKNFSQKRKKDFFIDAYNISEKIYFNTNIKGICAEKDLYTLSNDTTNAKDVLAIENMYANFLEPIYEESYKILTNPKILQLTPSQHANILIGIFQFYARNPKWMYDAIEKHKVIIARQLKIAKSANIISILYLDKKFRLEDNIEEKILDFVKSELIKTFKEKHLDGTREIFEYHADAKFEICHLIDNSSFITGDNPLVGKDIVNDNSHPLLRSKEFIIPLNPKVGLRLHHDNRKKLYNIYRYGGKNGNADTFNEKVINNSSRFILGTQENIERHFILTKKIKAVQDDIHKRIKIYKQIVKVIKMSDYGNETIKFMEQLIQKYEETGQITKEEELQMHKAIKKNNTVWKK